MNRSASIAEKDEMEDYDRSLELRQMARFILIAGLLVFITGIFIYIVFFAN